MNVTAGQQIVTQENREKEVRKGPEHVIGFGDDTRVSLEQLLADAAAATESFHRFATSLTSTETTVTTIARTLRERLTRL